MSGYVRIHRALIGHPAFRNDAEALAFAWMVINAAWKPIRVRYQERAVSLARGQLAVSVRDLARAMDRDKGWVERLLKRLKSEAMIETTDETGVSVITIRNYDEYQAEKDTAKTPAETPAETGARQGQDTEQGREEGKKEGKTRKRVRTPDYEIPDWVPAEPWAAFEAMRRRKSKPLDSYIAKQLFGRLRSIRDAGWSLEDVINKAAIHCHDGFWMPDGRDPNVRRASTPTATRSPEELEERARFFERIDKPDEAARFRKEAEKIRGKPPPQIANIIHSAARSMRAQ